MKSRIRNKWCSLKKIYNIPHGIHRKLKLLERKRSEVDTHKSNNIENRIKPNGSFN